MNSLAVVSLSIVAVVATGCSSPLHLAMSDNAIQSASNYNLCRGVFSMYSSRAMEAEAERRGVDCSVYAGAIAADRARKAQIVQSYNESIQRPQPAPVVPQGPKVTRCEQLGYAVNCTTY